jgi:CAAX protease family protein
MTHERLSAHGPLSWLTPHLKGHALLFDRKSPAMYDSSNGLKLLAIVVLLEGVIGPRLWLWNMTHLPMPPAWLRVSVLLALAVILVRFAAKVRLTDIGLRPWKEWSTTERSYLFQVVVLANVVFSLLFANRLRRVLADPTTRQTVWVLVVTYLIWGFYQEFIYRGVLQTELVRRWGGVTGILVSNVLYTFGPLHFYHFSAQSPSARLMIFVAIFVIGLFFGVLFRRSGNLWIIGIFHGIGDFYITGLGQMAN